MQMRDIEREILDLRGKVAGTRFQFLLAEVQACYTALDLAEFELSRKRLDVVEMEIAAVDKAISVIERFSPETSDSQQKQLKNSVCDIRAKQKSLGEKMWVGGGPPAES